MYRAVLLIGLSSLSLLASLPAQAAGAGRAPDAIVTALPVAPARGPANIQRAPFSPPRHALGLTGRRAPLATASPAAASTLSPASTVTQNAAGISAAVVEATTMKYYSPSDSTGAAGPNHYIETVNSAIQIFDKSLAPVTGALMSLDSFTGTSVPFHFDPQIQWDAQSQRWYYALDAVYNGNDNRLAFGWTKREGDPTDLTLTAADWCRFEIATGADFNDFPKLGHDAANVIIGTNIFDINGIFLTGSITVVPKPAAGTITTCGSPAAYQFGTGSSPLFYPSAPYKAQPVLTPVPANTTDGGSGGIVSVCCAGSTPAKLFGWHIGAGPTLVADVAVTVSTFNLPQDIPQPGTGRTLDPFDTRLTQAVAHYDPDAGAEAVWTQHTIDNAGPSAVRWYEYIPSTGTLRQAGTVTSGALYVFNGAISPVGAGNAAAIVYNTGSNSAFVAARAQSHTSSDPLGQMSGEVTLATGSVADTDFSCGSNPTDPNQCRWGDYAAASPDPSDPASAWVTTMLAGTGGTSNTAGWATQNSALRLRIASTIGPTPMPVPSATRIPPGPSSPTPSPAPRVSPQAPLTVPAASPISTPAPVPAPAPAPAASSAPAPTAAEPPSVVANPLFGFTS